MINVYNKAKKKYSEKTEDDIKNQQKKKIQIPTTQQIMCFSFFVDF
jgi:hypothetical protein